MRISDWSSDVFSSDLWWLYCEDLFSIQFGIKRLAGIPQGEEAVRGFERIYGRPMPEFDYYMAISALKHAMLAIRDYSNGKTLGAPEALPKDRKSTRLNSSH